MSDEMPAWAVAMEARAEARDQHLLTEVTGALAELRSEITRRFETHDGPIADAILMAVAEQIAALERRLSDRSDRFEAHVDTRLDKLMRRLGATDHLG